MVLGIWAGAWFVVPAVGWAVGLLPLGLLVWIDPRPSLWAALRRLRWSPPATVVRRVLIEARLMRLGVAPHVLSIGIGVGIADFAGSLVVLVLGAMVFAALTSGHRPGPPTGWVLDDRHLGSIAGITIPKGWRAALLAMGMTVTGVLLWVLLDRASGPVHLGGDRRFRGDRRQQAGSDARTTYAPATRAGLDAGAHTGGGDVGAGDRQRARRRRQGDDDDHRALARRGCRSRGHALDHRAMAQDRNAAVWVEEQMNDLPQRLDSVRPEEWLPTIGARLIDLFWIVLFATALLIDGPRLLRGIERRVPARHRRQYSQDDQRHWARRWRATRPAPRSSPASTPRSCSR